MKKNLFLILLIIVLQDLALCQEPKRASSYSAKNEYFLDGKNAKLEFASNKIVTTHKASDSILFDYARQEKASSPAAFKNNTSTRNYFRIDDKSETLWNGKHWCSEDYPLKVFVKAGSKSKIKKSIMTYLGYAMKSWELADNRITFELVDKEKDAQIVIWAQNNLMDKYEEDYLGLTNYETSKDKHINKVIIEIGTFKFNNEIITDGEIKTTLIHELGHALGLGHSDNAFDMMFPFIDSGVSTLMNFNELTDADKAAIKSAVDFGINFNNRNK